MRDSGTNFVGLKDGRAVAIATRFTGPGADDENAETLREYEERGYEVQTHPRKVAVAMHLAALSK